MITLRKLLSFFKKLIDRSIRNRMIIYFSILVIVSMTFLGMFSYYKTSDTLITEIIDYTTTIVEQTVMNVDLYFEDIKQTAVFISTKPYVLEILADYNSMDWGQRLQKTRFMQEDINSIISVKPNINDVILISKTGFRANASLIEEMDSQYDFYSQTWFKGVYEKDQNGVKFISLHPQDYYSKLSLNSAIKEDSKTVSVIMFPRDSAYENLGFVMCDFKLDNLNKSFHSLKLKNGGDIYLIDNDGFIVFHQDKGMIGKKVDASVSDIVFDGKDRGQTIIDSEKDKATLLMHATSRINGWKVVGSIPMSTIYMQGERIKTITYRILFICVIVVIFVSFFITTGITKPLSNLVRYMKQAETANFDIEVVRTGYGEVAELERKFREMIKKINMLITEVYQAKLKQSEAEYDALQSQINPHFLYNTLQMIKAEAVISKNTTISQMITSLGYILRYAVYEKKEMVPIRDEVEYIENYFNIYRSRFEGRVKFNLVVDDSILDYRIPKLTIQPILENSLTHGLSEKNSDGDINIVICNSSDKILIEVRDNGCGIEDQKIRDIMNSMDINCDEKSIGLKNVHERLKIKFGEDYSIKIDSIVGKFTSVKIIVPRTK